MLLRMQAELWYFLWSMGAGAGMGSLGSGMRWLHLRRRASIWLGLLDLLYWLLSGLALFLLCFYENSGILRGYAVVGTLAGWRLWKALTRLNGYVRDKKR